MQPSDSPPSAFLRAWSAIPCAVFALFMLGILLADLHYSVAYVLIFLTGLMLLLAMRPVLSREIPWYSPHFFVLLWLFLIEVAAALASGFYRYESAVFGVPMPPGLYAQAALVGTVGVASYLLGWHLGPKQPRGSNLLEDALQDSPAMQKLVPAYALAVLCCSMVAWAYMYTIVGGVSEHLHNQGQGRGEMTYSAGGLVWHIARFGYVAALLLFARFGPFNPVSWVCVGAYGLALVGFGSRSFAATLILGLIIVYFMRFRKSIRFWPFAVLFGVMAVGTIGMRIYRQSLGNINDAITLYEEKTATAENIVGLILGDVSFIIQRAELIDYLHDTANYQLGYLYLGLLRLIPNKLFPGIDLRLPSGNIFYIANLRPELLYKVSLSSNFFTEFYINFSYVGVILGGMLFGFVLRWWHSRLAMPLIRKSQFIPPIFLGLLGIQLFALCKSGVQVLLDWFYIFLPLVPILWYNRFSKRSY